MERSLHGIHADGPTGLEKKELPNCRAGPDPRHFGVEYDDPADDDEDPGQIGTFSCSSTSDRNPTSSSRSKTSMVSGPISASPASTSSRSTPTS